MLNIACGVALRSWAGACRIVPESSRSFADWVSLTGSIARGINAIFVADGPNFAVLADAVREIAAFLGGRDDYAGLLVAKDSTSYAGTNPGTSHMIFEGTHLNGRATLVFKSTSYSPPVTGSVATMTVVPQVDTVSVGNARQFSVEAYDASGLPIANPPVSWSTSNSGVATVNSSGFVTGVALGSATITASANGVTSSAPVTVMTAPFKVTISGPTSVAPPGGACNYIATPSGGATGNVSYEWYINNQLDPAGTTGSWITVDVYTTTSISVIARDEIGAEVGYGITARLVRGAPACMQ